MRMFLHRVHLYCVLLYVQSTEIDGEIRVDVVVVVVVVVV